jgi:hypothetical protein
VPRPAKPARQNVRVVVCSGKGRFYPFKRILLWAQRPS